MGLPAFTLEAGCGGGVVVSAGDSNIAAGPTGAWYAISLLVNPASIFRAFEELHNQYTN